MVDLNRHQFYELIYGAMKNGKATGHGHTATLER